MRRPTAGEALVAVALIAVWLALTIAACQMRPW